MYRRSSLGDVSRARSVGRACSVGASSRTSCRLVCGIVWFPPVTRKTRVQFPAAEFAIGFLVSCASRPPVVTLGLPACACARGGCWCGAAASQSRCAQAWQMVPRGLEPRTSRTCPHGRRNAAGSVLSTGCFSSTSSRSCWHRSVAQRRACNEEPPVGFEPTTSRLLSGCSAN